MEQRVRLQKILEEILGSSNVYFQPPESIRLTYPCIIYQLSSRDTTFADDNPYRVSKRYQITFISSEADDTTPDKIALLPMCVMDRAYTVDNLYHQIFYLYFH